MPGASVGQDDAERDPGDDGAAPKAEQHKDEYLLHALLALGACALS